MNILTSLKRRFTTAELPPIEGKNLNMGAGKSTESSVRSIVNSGTLLFLDQLVIAAGSWVYWLIISRMVSSSDVGHATSVYSLVILMSTLIQLGFEYPLLKRVAQQKILGSAVMIEMVLTGTIIPVIIYFSMAGYHETQEMTLLAVGILVFSSLNFIGRFALLGVSKTKFVFICDLVGSVVKFAAGFILISAGFGVDGIVISFLLQSAVVAIGYGVFSRKVLKFTSPSLSQIRELLKDGLVNTPSKLSALFVVSLAVLLLSWFGVDDSEIGVFYIAVMMSIVAGSFASSIAFMSIPATTSSGQDLSSGALRYSLCFTIPVVVALVVGADGVLSIIGDEFVSGSSILGVLALAVFPSALTSNVISKLNIERKFRSILIIGSMRLVIFLVSFLSLVPEYGTMGAALAVLASLGITGLLSFVWLERRARIFVGTSSLSLVAGALTGVALSWILPYQQLLSMTAALLVSIGLLFLLKVTSFRELLLIARSSGISNASR